MLVVSRFAVPVEEGGDFADRAETALRAFSACRGYQRGSLGRAVDDAAVWLLVTEWDNVGAYRRALSSYDVKVRTTQLLGRAAAEPSAFELLRLVEPGGAVVARDPDRAPDADRSAVGDAARRGSRLPHPTVGSEE